MDGSTGDFLRMVGLSALGALLVAGGILNVVAALRRERAAKAAKRAASAAKTKRR